ncbi:unnamed protein product [Alternaria alternata]
MPPRSLHRGSFQDCENGGIFMKSSVQMCREEQWIDIQFSTQDSDHFDGQVFDK